jgi:hypothetical protein
MIKVGMLLICSINIGSPVSRGSIFVKNVPTKVLHITLDNEALIEYDLRAVKGIRYTDDEKIKELVKVVDMTTPNYMNCKRK